MHDPSSALYLPLRTVHLLGVVLFLGGLVAALLWKLAADRSGDAAFAAKVHRTIRKLDGRVVGPGALLTFAGGYSMVRFLGGRISQHGFVLWGLILMFLALALWYFGMRRSGDDLADEAEAAAKGGQALTAAYAKRSVGWLASGAGALLLVLVVFILMVFRLPSG